MNFQNNYVNIIFDHFPKVSIIVKDHSPNKKEFEEFLVGMKNTYENKQDRIVIFDLKDARNVSISFLLKFIKWSKNMDPIFAQYLKGVSFFVGNKQIARLLKFIFFVQKPVYTFKVFYLWNDVLAHQKELEQNGNYQNQYLLLCGRYYSK